MAERSEAKKREAKLLVKFLDFKYFWREASLRVLNLASLAMIILNTLNIHSVY